MALPKKILLINWRDPKNPDAGGAEDYLLEIFKRLARKGHQIIWVAAGFKGGRPEEELGGLQIIRLSGPNFLFAWNFFRYYRKKLKKEKFDLVIDSISKLPLLTPFYVKEPLLGIFYQFHGRIFFKELFWPVAVFCYFLELLTGWIYRKQKIAAISESTRAELIQFGFTAQNIHLVQPAIEADRYQFDLSQKNSWPGCLYLGRLKKYKGLEDLLKAWVIILKVYPEARLEIIGRGSDLGRLKKMVRKLGVNQSVTFLGFLNEPEKIACLAKSWVMVYPSMREGFGLALLEANASGVPVVGYKVAGIKDVIQPGKTGQLVPFGDVIGLARSVTELLANTVKRENQSRAAREFSLKFNWDESARRLEEIMGAIIQK